MSGFLVPGVRIGHWTGTHTGVTVVLFPDATVGSCEVRGGAPASRETDVLEPSRTVDRVDAFVLSGGSAFGLATADGVMRVLRGRDQGYPTAGGVVPIVPTAAIFDLLEGDVWPGPDEGAAAADAAFSGAPPARGSVGAGRGATIGKWRGREHAVAGGLGFASTMAEGAHVGAVAVVNAVGDVVGADGHVLAGSQAPAGTPAFPTPQPFEEPSFEERGNTTLVVIATDAACDKFACHLLAQSAHDGLARALHPAHTRFDGDLAFAAATGARDVHFDRLREAAASCAAEAIRNAVAPG